MKFGVYREVLPGIVIHCGTLMAENKMMRTPSVENWPGEANGFSSESQKHYMKENTSLDSNTRKDGHGLNVHMTRWGDSPGYKEFEMMINSAF